MGIYWLSWKDISSQNLGTAYRMYHGITFTWLTMSHRTSLHRTYNRITLLWFATFHRTSLLWIVSPHVRLYSTSLNKIMWYGDECFLGSVSSQVCIWGVLQDPLNLSSEFLEVIPLQWFGKVASQYFTCWAIFDLQVFHCFAYVFRPIATWQSSIIFKDHGLQFVLIHDRLLDIDPLRLNKIP